MMRTTVKWLLWMVVAAASWPIQACPAQQSVWVEEFEGVSTSWRPAAADTRYQRISHARVRGQVHRGDQSERICVEASNGTYVYYTHPIPAARLIDEFVASVWIRANRPGMQLMARLVLPRATDPRTGRPVTTLVRGTIYRAAGTWEQLSVRGLREKLSRQARVLRSQLGTDVDPREAYVDQLVLNVYGGRGQNVIWVDDLELAGLVTVERQPLTIPLAGATPQPMRGRVSLEGAILRVDGRPTVPRIIRHRGEPLEYLQQLGFNVVQLERPASRELLAEAERLKLWLIAPPPDEPISRKYDSVLAWHLGERLSRHELSQTQQRAQASRGSDSLQGRLLVAGVQTELRAYSRAVDVLVVGQEILGTSLELNGHGEWLRTRHQLARHGTPLWVRVQTDPDPRQWAQIAAVTQLLGEAPSQLPAWEAQLMRQQVHLALAAGAHGILFDSHAPLTAHDLANRQRAAALEWINQELKLLEPWAASGRAMAANGGDVLLQVGRARVLLPGDARPAEQLVAAPYGDGSRTLVIPGVPETNSVFQLTPVGLFPLSHQRVTGGMQIQQTTTAGRPLVMLTSDTGVIGSLSRLSAAGSRRSAELARQLARTQLQMVESVEAAWPPDAGVTAAIQQARNHLGRAETRLAAADITRSYQASQQMLDALASARRRRWEIAVQDWPSPLSSPLAISHSTLRLQPRLADLIRQSQSVPSTLPGGTFESLNQLTSSGWRHIQHPLPGVSSRVELSHGTPRNGHFCLQMVTEVNDPEIAPAVLESAPLWISSPAIEVTPGTLVQIRGWVRIEKQITGSQDGLLVFDNHGGRTLAMRMQAKPDWQEFVLYRAVGDTGQVNVTLALTGYGKVCVDDVAIEAVVAAETPYAAPSVAQFRDGTSSP